MILRVKGHGDTRITVRCGKPDGSLCLTWYHYTIEPFLRFSANDPIELDDFYLCCGRPALVAIHDVRGGDELRLGLIVVPLLQAGSVIEVKGRRVELVGGYVHFAVYAPRGGRPCQYRTYSDLWRFDMLYKQYVTVDDSKDPLDALIDALRSYYASDVGSIWSRRSELERRAESWERRYYPILRIIDDACNFESTGRFGEHLAYEMPSPVFRCEDKCYGDEHERAVAVQPQPAPQPLQPAVATAAAAAAVEEAPEQPEHAEERAVQPPKPVHEVQERQHKRRVEYGESIVSRIERLIEELERMSEEGE